MKIREICMKTVTDDGIYYRMWVNASELPEWIYEEAKKMDAGCEYLSDRDEQCFEIEGYISDNKANDLQVVYYWDDYETIAELDRDEHSDIYKAFEDFANRYGDRFPDNGELCLGDSEYENKIRNITDKIKEESRG